MPDRAFATGLVSPPLVRIGPPAHSWLAVGLRQVLAYHELLCFLVLRLVTLRYKQTFFAIRTEGGP